jgi:ribose 5-phosphate isomerase A
MKLNPIEQTRLKQEVAKKAVEFVKPGMCIGLGTGSTAALFIEELCKRKLSIKAASSSERSTEAARAGGIEVVSMDEIEQLDLTIDSADEVDPKGNLIKGGGGALTREKIVASSSKEVIIIVDESKLVPKLGDFGLPIEILPFGLKATLKRLEKLGYRGHVRKKGEVLYLTDNGNVILDLEPPPYFENPKKHHETLIAQPGVVETGLFFDLPMRILVAYENGEVTWMKE